MIDAEKLAAIEAYCRKYAAATHPKYILRTWFNNPAVPKPALPVGTLDLIDGQFQTEYGINWGAWEMQNNKPRSFIKKKVVNHSRDNIRVMAWAGGQAQAVNPPVIIEDVICENARANPPKSLDGTSESNLWVGCTANCKRVVLRNGAWMGLWTGGDTMLANGGCTGSTFEDFTIENQRIGVYIEHITRGCLFKRFSIKASEIGINVEWWYGGRGSHSCTIEDFDITINGNYPTNDRRGWAISLDAGTYGFKIRNGIIRGSKGIELPKRMAGGTSNVIENVRRPDGSPVPIIYHDRAIG